ncbi:MAG: DM13 domain-containing protein [Pseudonocardiaceae bacterium]
MTEHDRPRRTLRRRPAIWILSGIVVVLVVGLWAFQPWKLWTRSMVDEALPGVPAAAPDALPAPDAAAASDAPPVPDAPVAPAAAPVVLAEGQFVTQEHETTGLARLVQLPDGSRLVRFEGLSTSDGPDLHIWLTDQTAGGEWGKYDDGRHVALGELKATDGNQNYAIPPDADLTGLTSVVIWCDRFNVAFGSASLAH